MTLKIVGRAGGLRTGIRERNGWMSLIPVRKPPALLVSTHQAPPFRRARTRARTRIEPLDANEIGDHGCR